MSNGCEVNDAKNPILSSDPRDIIEIVGGDNIVVDEVKSATKTVYTINYQETRPPLINDGLDAIITKVGVNLPVVNFNGNIVQGSSSIATRAMVPDKGLDLTAPFNWQELNVLGTSPGLWPRFSGEPLTITATDSQGMTAVKQVGVEYRHLFYVGYSFNEVLSEAEIKNLINNTDLLTNISSKYSEYTYNYSIAPVFIYWAFPVDTPGFTAAAEGPLPVPLKLDLSDVTVTDEGVPKQYRVIRTSVKTKLTNALITIQ